MSYDLNFWRYRDELRLDHQDVYESLSDGQLVDGLVDLPIKDILDKIEQTFVGQWQRTFDDTWECGPSRFTVYTTQQFVRVDCYSVKGEDMNRIIDVFVHFDCPLFDPQAGERFTC